MASTKPAPLLIASSTEVSRLLQFDLRSGLAATRAAGVTSTPAVTEFVSDADTAAADLLPALQSLRVLLEVMWTPAEVPTKLNTKTYTEALLPLVAHSAPLVACNAAACLRLLAFDTYETPNAAVSRDNAVGYATRVATQLVSAPAHSDELWLQGLKAVHHWLAGLSAPVAGLGATLTTLLTALLTDPAHATSRTVEVADALFAVLGNYEALPGAGPEEFVAAYGQPVPAPCMPPYNAEAIEKAVAEPEIAAALDARLQGVSTQTTLERALALVQGTRALGPTGYLLGDRFTRPSAFRASAEDFSPLDIVAAQRALTATLPRLLADASAAATAAAAAGALPAGTTAVSLAARALSFAVAFIAHHGMGLAPYADVLALTAQLCATGEPLLTGVQSVLIAARRKPASSGAEAAVAPYATIALAELVNAIADLARMARAGPTTLQLAAEAGALTVAKAFSKTVPVRDVMAASLRLHAMCLADARAHALVGSPAEAAAVFVPFAATPGDAHLRAGGRAAAAALLMHDRTLRAGFAALVTHKLPDALVSAWVVAGMAEQLDIARLVRFISDRMGHEVNVLAPFAEVCQLIDDNTDEAGREGRKFPAWYIAQKATST